MRFHKKGIAQVLVLGVTLFVLAAGTASASPPISSASDVPGVVYPANAVSSPTSNGPLTLAREEFPELVSWNGGPVEHHPHVHVIFWGSDWNKIPGTREKVLAFYQWVNGSPMAQMQSQYYDRSGYIGTQIDLSGSWTDARVGHPAGPLTEDQIKNEVDYAISNIGGFAHTGGIDDQYVIVTPEQTSPMTIEGAAFCGEHGWQGEPWSLSWAVVQWVPGCFRGLLAWQDLEVIASHEFYEAASDPIPAKLFTGWRIPGARELTDMCNNHSESERFEATPGIWSSRSWSNYRYAGGQNGCSDGEVPEAFEVKATTSFVQGSTKALVFGTVRRACMPAYYRFVIEGPGGSFNAPANETVVPNPECGSANTVGAELTGLTPNTTYHYHVLAASLEGYGAQNFEAGSLQSGTLQFTTEPVVPSVSNVSANGTTPSGTTVEGEINPHGSSTTYQVEYGLTESYGSKVPVPPGSVGSGTAAVKISQSLSGLFPEKTYHYRVVATNSFGSTPSADQMFATKALPATVVSSFGSPGTGNGQFSSPPGTTLAPGGIVVGGNGNLYATDPGGNRVEKFGPAGEYLSQFGAGGTGNGQFNVPLGIALDPAGHLFVADSGNHRIEEVNANGVFIAQFGPGEGGVQPLSLPRDVVADKKGHIFASDPERGVVYEYSVEGLGPEGNHLLGAPPFGAPFQNSLLSMGLGYESGGENIWGANGASSTIMERNTSPGCDSCPYITRYETPGSGSDIAWRPNSFFVLDRSNNRVEQFVKEGGGLLAQFGQGGSGAGQLNQPLSIAYGKGNIYIADAGNYRIERWTQAGQPEATTQAATSITSSGAALNASIAPVGAATTYHFEYGTTTSYGTSVPVPDEAVGSGFEAVVKSKPISGLATGTTYHFRVVASSPYGTVVGEDLTFKTL